MYRTLDDFTISESACPGGAVRLTVMGRITSNQAEILEKRLFEILEGDFPTVIINMEKVQFLSSVGIRTLLSAHKKAKERDGALYIERPSENVKNVIGMVALDMMLMPAR